MSITLNAEKLLGVDPRLADTLITTWNAELEFDRRVIQGIRTPAQVAEDWAKGRTQVTEANMHESWAQGHLVGQWVVTNKAEVVTNAQHPEQTPHCHGGGIDVMPVIFGRIVWSEKDPSWNVCLEHLRAMAEIAKRQGLIWGGDFPEITGGKAPADYDHFQVPNWRALPMVNGSGLRPV